MNAIHEPLSSECFSCGAEVGEECRPWCTGEEDNVCGSCNDVVIAQDEEICEECRRFWRAENDAHDAYYYN